MAIEAIVRLVIALTLASVNSLEQLKRSALPPTRK
jgi:hypothetical protein